MEILMDFRADFASACIKALVTAGFQRPEGDSGQIIAAYFNVIHRMVPRVPRRVHKARYVVPPEYIAGEKALLTAVKSGDDLRPYMSLKVESTRFNDGMLNDYGIHHFHLGIAPHPNRPKFKKRSGPLLFAMVRGLDFYCIGCFKHGDWAERHLLDIIHENWPHIISTSAINDPSGRALGFGKLPVVKLSREYTTEEISILRKANINVPTTRADGTVHFGPGGGISGDGTSIEASMRALNIIADCRLAEREVRSLLAKRHGLTKHNGPLTVRLEQRGIDTFAVPDDGSPAIDLHRRLRVFSLGIRPLSA